MADTKLPETVNRGPTGEDRKDKEREREFDIAGNVERKGEDPSPDNRERGETSQKDRQPPVDTDR